MSAINFGWRARLAIWLGILLAAAAVPAKAAGNYISDPGEAKRAIGAILDKLGQNPDVHSIRITGRGVTLTVRGRQRPADLEEWQIRTRNRFFFFDTETVAGPSSRAAPAIVADLSSGFFPIEGVALETIPIVAERALAYAGLQGRPSVESIEIARRVHLLPVQSYGDVRWSIYVATPKESATVYADATGRITGANLANTARARSVNLIADTDWPKEGALANLIAFVGEAKRVRDLTIRATSIQVKADHPTIEGQTQSYSWDLSGVQRSGFLSPLFPGPRDEPLFSLKEVDLENLGDIRDAALKAWGNDNVNISYMMLRRFTDGPGKPELRWTIHIIDLGKPDEVMLFGNSGSVEIDTKGVVKATNLPDSRKPVLNWLEPAEAARMLGVANREFGEGARFAEIIVDRNTLRILAEVPDQPGTMRSYTLASSGISASSMMMPWDAEFRPERLFAMPDIAFFTAEKINELIARTHTRLIVGSEMSVARLTFSIGQLMAPDGSFMVPSPDGKVTLEIRLESPDGFKGGRVTYSATGEEIDVVMP